MPDESNRIRKKRFILNVSLTVFYEIVMILYGFILPKLYISYYGSEVNGLMSSITKFLGFISICELGLGAVVTSNLYKPVAEKDWTQVSRLVISGKKFYRIIAIILGAYTVALTVLFPYVIKTSFNPLYVISMVLIISASSFAQYFFGITYTMVLKADQKEYINCIFNTVSVVLNIVFSYLLIVNGASVHIARGVTALIYVVRPLLLMWYVERKYPLTKKLKVEGEPIKQKWNGLAQHLAYIVQDNTDTIILTFFSSLQYVSIYSVYYNVVNGVKKLLNSVNVGMSSLLGNIYAKNETDNLKKVFSQYEWVTHTVSTLLFGVTAVLITPFITVYTKGITDADYIQPLFGILISVAILFWCYQRPYNMMIQAATKYKETQIYSIVEPVINIAVSIVLVSKYGLIGVAIGTIVSMAYRMIFLVKYFTKDVLFLSPWAFVKRMAVDFVMFAAIFASKYIITLGEATYLSWVFMAVKAGLFGILVCVLINLIFYRRFTIDFVRKFAKKLKK